MRNDHSIEGTTILQVVGYGVTTTEEKHTTTILYWTDRAELTNDPSFRVNQKWMTVQPHASVRKRWNTTVRFATSYDSLCDR